MTTRVSHHAELASRLSLPHPTHLEWVTSEGTSEGIGHIDVLTGRTGNLGQRGFSHAACCTGVGFELASGSACCMMHDAAPRWLSPSSPAPSRPPILPSFHPRLAVVLCAPHSHPAHSPSLSLATPLLSMSVPHLCQPHPLPFPPSSSLALTLAALDRKLTAKTTSQ